VGIYAGFWKIPSPVHESSPWNTLGLMAKCNEIISKMMLYDNNDDEHIRQQCRFWRKSALQTPYSPLYSPYAMWTLLSLAQ